MIAGGDGRGGRSVWGPLGNVPEEATYATSAASLLGSESVITNGFKKSIPWQITHGGLL